MRLAAGLLILIASSASADDVPIVSYGAATCGNYDHPTREFAVLPDGTVADDKQLEMLASDKAPKARTAKRIEGSEWVGGWCVAQVAVKAGKQTLSLVVTDVGEYTGLGGDSFEARVSMIAKPITDKDAAKLPPPPKVTGSADGNDWVGALAGLASPDKQAAVWAKRDDVILVGSGPGEIYQGKTAREKLPKWNLKLVLDGGMMTDTVPTSRGQLAYVYSNVVATPVKGGPAVTYRGFFVLLADHAKITDEDKRPEHDTWHLVLAHFAR